MKMKLGLLSLAVWMFVLCLKWTGAMIEARAAAETPTPASVLSKRAAGVYFSVEPTDTTFFVSTLPDDPEARARIRADLK